MTGFPILSGLGTDLYYGDAFAAERAALYEYNFGELHRLIVAREEGGLFVDETDLRVAAATDPHYIIFRRGDDPVIRYRRGCWRLMTHYTVEQWIRKATGGDPSAVGVVIMSYGRLGRFLPRGMKDMFKNRWFNQLIFRLKFVGMRVQTDCFDMRREGELQWCCRLTEEDVRSAGYTTELLAKPMRSLLVCLPPAIINSYYEGVWLVDTCYAECCNLRQQASDQRITTESPTTVNGFTSNRRTYGQFAAGLTPVGFDEFRRVCWANNTLLIEASEEVARVVIARLKERCKDSAVPLLVEPAPLDRCIQVMSKPPYFASKHNKDVRREWYSLVWHRSAMFRWPYNHGVVVDAALVLNQLPPYVLLEVLDWLPIIRLQQHHLKIKLLFGIKGSIDRILEAREARICRLRDMRNECAKRAIECE